MGGLKPRRRRRGYLVGAAVGFIVLAVVVGISASVVTTRQGVNFKVSNREIPLYIKVFDFVYRHYQYRTLANEITRGLGSDRERVLRSLGMRPH